jgi:3-hydroxyisobutyrate dehydrogenase
MAAKHGGVLPVVESTIDQYEELMAEGYGDEDISAIYRLKSKLFPPKPESM